MELHRSLQMLVPNKVLTTSMKLFANSLLLPSVNTNGCSVFPMDNVCIIHSWNDLIYVCILGNVENFGLGGKWLSKNIPLPMLNLLKLKRKLLIIYCVNSICD